MRSDVAELLLDWGRCHQLLDLLDVDDAPTLFGRVRKLLSRVGHSGPCKRHEGQTDEEEEEEAETQAMASADAENTGPR